jgi:hypothetical protein
LDFPCTACALLPERLKIQPVHPSAWNCVHWLPRCAMTVIYCCIKLLQLLYRWQYKSRKLFIPPHLK